MPDLKILDIFEGKVQKRGDMEMVLNNDDTFREGPVFISGIDKIVQDVMKGVLTRLGSNFMSPSFGTSLETLLHSRKLEDVSSQIVSEIQFLLGYLGQFNANEPDNEKINRLLVLKAKENSDTIEIDLKVETVSGQVVGVSV